MNYLLQLSDGVQGILIVAAVLITIGILVYVERRKGKI